uniref:Uncharacterized protein n=1 Tax=Arundo donax TaxID=35708 RepID=A0A0A9BT01_ARUDO
MHRRTQHRVYGGVDEETVERSNVLCFCNSYHAEVIDSFP